MKKLINEQFKRMQLLAGLITESQLEEVAGEDLELKSSAKQIFSVLKKYGLKPQYEADGKQFMSKDPSQSGYGAYIHVNNGIMTISVYDRGIWQTIQRKQKTNELDMGNVSYPTAEEKKQINQIAGKIYNDIISVLGKDKFEFKNNQEPDKYGNYMIYVRKKSTVNPNQRPNTPKPAAPVPTSESTDIEKLVNEEFRRMQKLAGIINENETNIVEPVLDNSKVQSVGKELTNDPALLQKAMEKLNKLGIDKATIEKAAQAYSSGQEVGNIIDDKIIDASEKLNEDWKGALGGLVGGGMLGTLMAGTLGNAPDAIAMLVGAVIVGLAGTLIGSATDRL